MFRRAHTVRKIIVAYLVASLAIPSGMVSARTLPQSVLDSLNVTAPGRNALPTAKNPLAEDFYNGVVVAGEADISKDGSTLLIDQKTAKALLEWATFDIGQDSTVHFQQDSNATAVNIIDDIKPSKIFGSLKADGQVYLLNHNGVIFGESAQVNVRGMIAAAARLNGYEDVSALSEEQKLNFLENSLLSVIGEDKALLVVDDEAIRNNAIEDLPRIVVQQGAQLTSEDAPLMLAGPEVVNAGDLRSENSQVVLAASRKDTYLAVSDNDPNLRGYLVEVNSGDGEERGRVVNAGSIVSTLGNVTLVASDIIQAGKIEATTAVDVNGSIRILARDQAELADFSGLASGDGRWGALYFDVNENGFADTTQAPSIGTLAYGTEAGTVEFYEGSQTQVSIQNLDHAKVDQVLAENPEINRDDFYALSETRQMQLLADLVEDSDTLAGLVKTATDSLVQGESRIDIEGKVIEVAEDALIRARGGETGAAISLRARENVTDLLNQSDTDSTASIVIEDGAVIDASGTTDTELEAERNILQFFVTSNDVKDVEHQKGGNLLRETVNVDIREGTELFDWEQGLASVKKTASERSTQGGTIDIVTTGSVEVGNQARLDVSGGKVAYKAGTVTTSKVLQNGQIVSIADADARASVIDAIDLEQNTVQDEKWGERWVYNPYAFLTVDRRSYDAYVQGFDAGTINIVAPNQRYAEEAILKADVTAGFYQKEAGDAPTAGTITLDAKTLSSAIVDDVLVYAAVADIPESFTGMSLSERLIEASNAETLSVLTRGDLLIHDAVTLDLGLRDGLELEATDIAVFGDIRSLGGDVSLFATDYVDIDADIDVSGAWVNDFRKPQPSEVAIDAGNIDITGLDAIAVSNSSNLKANAGAYVSKDKKVSYGKAGEITFDLDSGVRPGGGIENDINNPGSKVRLTVDIQGNIEAIDNDNSGSLSIVGSDIVIGGAGNTNIQEGIVGGESTSMVLSDAFFETLKVGNVNVEAREGNLVIDADADLNMRHQGYVLEAGFEEIASSLDAGSALSPYLFPAADASAGSLGFKATTFAPGSGNGSIFMEQGASIHAGAESSIRFAANEQILINGEIDIAGGRVTATLSQFGDSDADADIANAIVIGEQANIDLSSTQLFSAGEEQITLGRIVDAGTLSLNARYGQVFVQNGANIDLGGAVYRGIVNTGGRGATGRNQLSVAVGAESGTLNVTAERGMLLDADVDFGRPDEGYRGGVLNLSLDSNARNRDSSQSPDSLRFMLGSDALDENNPFNSLDSLSLEDFWSAGDDFDMASLAEIDGLVAASAHVNSSLLNSGTLRELRIDVNNTRHPNNVSLPALSQIELVSDVSLAASERVFVDTASLNLDGNRLDIDSGYVALGESRGVADMQRTITGDANPEGLLNVDAYLIDLNGNLNISGDGSVNMRASEGIRTRSVVNGSFSTSGEDELFFDNAFSAHGNVNLQTPRVWAATLADFSIESEQALTITGEGNNSGALLSAGGSLQLSGDSVTIDTEISVPYGELAISATGTATDENPESGRITLGEHALLSVSNDETVPLGRIKADGFSWVYSPAGNENAQVNFDSPESTVLSKLIALEGESIFAAAGSQQDVSGSGNVYAQEFVAGLEGTIDVLAGQSYQQQFAIVPTLQSGYAAYDPVEFKGSNIPWGTQIEISGSKSLADGSYTIMPANYALMPNAYLVTPGDGAFLPRGTSYSDVTGAEVVSGRYRYQGSGQSELWTSFTIEGRDAISGKGDYRLTSANDYYQGQQYQPGTRPSDNGGLSIRVEDQLDFLGSVLASDTSGTGTYLDIASANPIVVTDIAEGDNENVLTVTAELFDRIGASSILLGAEREWANGAWDVTDADVASTIDLQNAVIDVPELLVLASDEIGLENASVAASGEAEFAGNQWRLGDGQTSLLVSNSDASSLNLEAVQASNGIIDIDDSSQISAAATLGLVFDGTALDPNAELPGALYRISSENVSAGGGRLQVFANTLSLGGENQANANIETGVLASASDLELKSSGSIRFRESAAIELNNARIESAQVALDNGVSVDINASGTVAMAGANAEIAGTSVDSELTISAEVVEFAGSADEANTTWLNLDAENVTLTATNGMRVNGALDLSAATGAGELVLNTPIIYAGEAGSRLAIESAGTLSVENTDIELDALATILSDAAAGVAFSLNGNDVYFNSHAVAQSGVVQINASNNIDIGTDAIIDASPLEVAFPNETLTGPAGYIQLSAQQNLSIADLASLRFGAENISGEDGGLSLAAGNMLDILDVSETAVWSAGGVDLSVQAGQFANASDEEGNLAELNALAMMNAQGVDDDLKIILSGAGENLTINQQLIANNLFLASAQGQLTVNGTLNALNATQDTVLYGDSGVRIGASAQLVHANSEGQDNGISLQSGQGLLDVAAGAALVSDGGLEVQVSADTLPDAGTRVILDGNDQIASEQLDLYLTTRVEDSLLTKADYAQYETDAIAALTGVDTSNYLALTESASGYAPILRPQLEVFSNGNLEIGSAFESINLIGLRNADGDAGRFVLNAANDLSINGGISDGVRILRPNPQDFSFAYIDDLDAFQPQFLDTFVLSDQDSSDIQISAGGFGAALSAASILSNAELRMASSGFVRTGTGDITINASGDLVKQSGAFIATLGKSRDTDAQGRPGWGSNPYFSNDEASLWRLDTSFSGFGIEAGDIHLDVGGNFVGGGSSQNQAEFMHRFTSTDNLDISGLDYSNINTWYAAIGDISGGVHAIGGGSIFADVRGSLNDAAFSTPGVGVWTEENGSPEIIEYQGGNLVLKSLGDISHSSFQNDGGRLSVFSRSSIVEGGASDTGILLTASDSDVSVSAVNDLVLEGIINTYMSPLNPNQFSFFVQNQSAFNHYFFDGYDNTRLNLSSIGGDVRVKADVEESIASFYGNNLSSTYELTQYAHYILPSQVGISALSGNIGFNSRGGEVDYTATIFPSRLASLSMLAYGNILGLNQGPTDPPLTFYIPDFSQSSLASINDVVSGDTLSTDKTTVGSLRQRGLLIPFSFSNDPQRNHGSSLLDRSDADPIEIVSLTGDIGSINGGIAFNMPAPLSAYAGGDFINASFYIQHTDPRDVSSIIAGGDFRYPLKRNDNDQLRESDTQLIRIAGPGELVLQTGGSIDLGTGIGIYSIGNSENPLLPEQGANLHIYAGVESFGDLQGLAGAAISSNSDVRILSESLSGAELQGASFIDWMLAFASVDLGSNGANGTGKVISESADDYALFKTLAEQVEAATGTSYIRSDESIRIGEAMADFDQLNTALQQRISVSALSDILVANPEQLSASAGELFFLPEIGDAGLTTGSERTRVFEEYFAQVSGFLTLDALQQPNRAADLFANVDSVSGYEDLADLSIPEQLAVAQEAFGKLDATRQTLVAESNMLRHNAQSGIEAGEADKSVAKFERGYVAQRLFFGESYDFALRMMQLKTSLFSSGSVAQLERDIERVSLGSLSEEQFLSSVARISGQSTEGISVDDVASIVTGLKDLDTLKLGGPGNSSLASMASVFGAWEQDSGVSFEYSESASRAGDIELTFSTIQTRRGGDISIFTPAGSANVGSSAALVESLLGSPKANDELGILAFAAGDISSVVADAFNVNESRTIPLAGGDVNLWSAYGSIDAGKGAKTAESTPPTDYSINLDTGSIVFFQAPSVSGSGISTQESRSNSSVTLTATQRLNQVEQGSGAAILTTPMGIVDAGEAGIQSAGDLFLAAAKVQGADNISVGGISAGVPTTTAISSDIGGLGSAVDAATQSVQESAEKAAAESASQQTAFVTIELL